MCITSWWYPKDHPTIKFVMIFNRDEALERSTTSAHWWQLDNNENIILSSTDDRTSKVSTDQTDLSNSQYEMASTWLGISKQGKFSCLNNLWLKPFASPTASSFEKALSRGYLVTNYLTTNQTPELYLNSIMKDAEEYAGFALLVGNIKDQTFGYLQNSEGEGYDKIQPLLIQDNELHILSNLGYPSNTKRAKKLYPQFKNIIEQNTDWEMIIEKLLNLLGPQSDSLLPSSDNLDDIYVGKQYRKGCLYGTETSTIILMNHDNEIQFIERNWYQKNDNSTKQFNFTI